MKAVLDANVFVSALINTRGTPKQLIDLKALIGEVQGLSDAVLQKDEPSREQLSEIASIYPLIDRFVGQANLLGAAMASLSALTGQLDRRSQALAEVYGGEEYTWFEPAYECWQEIDPELAAWVQSFNSFHFFGLSDSNMWKAFAVPAVPMAGQGKD